MTKSYTRPQLQYTLGAKPCDPFATEALQASTCVDPEGDARKLAAERWRRLLDFPTAAHTADNT
jgi:hypothetical protein